MFDEGEIPGVTANASLELSTGTRLNGWGVTLESANWKPPSHRALNGLGILCEGLRYRCFTTLPCAPNSVSNEPWFRRNHSLAPLPYLLSQCSLILLPTHPPTPCSTPVDPN